MAELMRHEVRRWAREVKGFLAEAEGLRLFELARECAGRAPCVEIGSYCGKSTLYLAEGCRLAGGYPVISIDHHRGSEEQQPGEEYFDPELFDHAVGRPDTLPCFRRTLQRAGLEEWVIAIVSDSARAGRCWPDGPASLLFIDGGHSEKAASADFEIWAPRVVPGGYLCIHDIFADPAKGGQAPYHVMQRALRSGGWSLVEQVETLGILRRRDDAP
jgi:MMP 1-O-methyltransferase